MFSIWKIGNGPESGVTIGINRTIPTPVLSLTSQSGDHWIHPCHSFQGPVIQHPLLICELCYLGAVNPIGHLPSVYLVQIMSQLAYHPLTIRMAQLSLLYLGSVLSLYIYEAVNGTGVCF